MNSLLAVFAHPDDESLACGGLLARCADEGARVVLLCVTHGEDSRAAHEGDRQAMRERRAQELREAARVLGISEVVLLDYPDGELPWLDVIRAGRLEEDIRSTIARVQPEVVITFGEDGLYWHPDHIVLYEKTTAAVTALGAAAPALYYVTMPFGAMRAVAETVARRSPGTSPNILGIDDPDAFGSLAAPPTLIVDVSAVAGRKLTALKCHRSQVAGGAIEQLEEADAPRLLGVEHFHRADIGASGPSFLERFAS